MSFARFIAPLAANRAAYFESLFLPLLVVAVGIWLNPLDPLWARSAFPWPWIAPIVLALRYGPFSGLFGALVLLGAWVGLGALGFGVGEFPKLYFLGGLIVVMICGEFSSIWRGRVRRAEAMQLYLDQRLEHLTHQHYLLRLSHDRMEQDLIARPVTMRDALTALRTLSAGAAEGEALPGAQEFLRLLSQYCQLEAAALFAMRDDEPAREPSAGIGMGFELDPSDALVRFALAENRLSHIQSAGPAEAVQPQYVIVAPLTTSAGGRRGLLVVQRVPFFALHEEMLHTLNLLLGYYADGLDVRATARPVLDAEPSCPPAMAFELVRLWRIRQESGVKSALVAMVFQSRPGQEDLPLQIRRQQRSLDVTWLIEQPARTVLLTLMPLASTGGAEGYLARVEGWVKQQRALSLEDAGISSHVFLLEDEPPIALLRRMKTTCNVTHDTRPSGVPA